MSRAAIEAAVGLVKKGAVAGLVAHDAVEEGAGVVRAHVGVGFGDALGLGRDVAQGPLQPASLARFINRVDGFEGGFQYGPKVVPHNAFPLPAYARNDIGVVS